MPNKITYNGRENRWELLDDIGNVMDYAEGHIDDAPWDLMWGSTIVKKGGSSSTTANAGHILKGETAISRGKLVVGDIPVHDTLTRVPSSDGSEYPSGYYRSIVVKGDTNLTPENIKAGITIFGVPGRLGPDHYIDTYTGNCEITPGISTYYLYTSGKIVPNDIVVRGDYNLAPENIREGVSIFGVVGSVNLASFMPVDGVNISDNYVLEGVKFIGIDGSTQSGTIPKYGVVRGRLPEIPYSFPKGYYERIDIIGAPESGDGIELYECAAVHTVIADGDSGAGEYTTWDGYRISRNQDGSDGWVRDEELTTGLVAQGYIPEVGKIYLKDTTAIVSELHGYDA